MRRKTLHGENVKYNKQLQRIKFHSAQFACLRTSRQKLMRNIIPAFLVLIAGLTISEVNAENSIPPEFVGPVISPEQALDAIKYFSAKESSLGPCGNITQDAKKVGNEWLIFITVEGYNSKSVSWRVWELDADTGKFLNVTDYNWKANISECEDI